MTDQLFRILDELDLSQVTTPAGLSSRSSIELLDIAASLAAATVVERPVHDPSLYAQWSSLSLAGAPQPCSGAKCRVGRVSRLTHYAALYSDRVYVSNLFGRHLVHQDTNRLSGEIDERFRSSFAVDIAIARMLRPLVERGLIAFVTTPAVLCSECVATAAYGEGANKRLTVQLAQLSRRFFKMISASIRKREHHYLLTLRGPEGILEHGVLTKRLPALPDVLRRMPRLAARIERGEDVELSGAARRQLQVHQSFVNDLKWEALTELAVSEVLDVPLVTENWAHVEMLGAVAGDADIERRNAIVERHLTAFVPFIEELSPSDLLKLRDREAEALVAFRSALNQAIDAVRGESYSLSDRQARAVYSDVLEPKLRMLDQRVRQAKHDLVRNVRDTTVAWAGAITFGMHTGLVPAELTAAATALGVTGVIASAARNVLSDARSTDCIRGEPLYFLWRLKKAAS